MKRSRTILLLACAAGGLVAAACGKPSPEPAMTEPKVDARLTCVLTPGATTFEAGSPVPIRFQLTNSSTETLHVLEWNTPLEGMFGDFFDVKRDGAVLPYQGPLVKRGDPDATSYRTIAPGASIDATVDLSKGYDVSAPGTYVVGSKGRLHDLLAAPTLTPRARGSHQGALAPCRDVTFQVVAKGAP
jgi:hypothetical protein